MGSIYHREKSKFIWIKYRDEGGNPQRKPTAFVQGQEKQATRYLRDLEEKIAAAKRAGAKEGPITVKQYVKPWLERRREFGIASVDDNEGHLENHVLPEIGHMKLEDVRASTLKNLFDGIRKQTGEHGSKLKTKTVWNIYGTVSAMFRDAQIDGLVEQSPCVLTVHQLGKIVERDSLEGAEDIYTRDEIALLIWSTELAHEQRMMHALRFFGRMRLGEACGVRWRHYDPAVEPLGRMTVAVSYDRDTTKTGRKRYVPVHPTFAALLAEWRMAWPTIYGRQPEPDDLLIPNVRTPGKGKRLPTGAMQTKSSAGKRFTADLEHLGLRHRRGHDLGSSFITLAEEDGADEARLKEVTHTEGKRKDGAFWKYLRRQWPTLSAEVAKLKIGRPVRGEVVRLPVAASGGVPSWAHQTPNQPREPRAADQEGDLQDQQNSSESPRNR